MANGIDIRPRTKKDGTKVYGLRVRKKGHYFSETYMKRATAVTEGTRVLAEMDAGTFIPKSEVVKSITLAEAFEKFIDELPDGTKREKTKKEGYKFQSNIVGRDKKLAKMALDKIQVKDVREFMKSREKEVADNTVRNNLNSISKIFTHAISEWDFAGPNPVKFLNKPSKAKPRDRRLESGEENIIVEEAEKSDAVYLPYLFRFLINTGMRLGEVSTMSPQDVYLDQGKVWLSDTKLDDPRFVPLPQSAVDVLEEFKPLWGDETVFHYNSTTISAAWFRFKNKLIKDGKLKSNLTLHDLRHEGLSRLFEIKNDKGEQVLSIADIVLISGHKDINTLINVYVKINADDTVTKLRRAGV